MKPLRLLAALFLLVACFASPARAGWYRHCPALREYHRRFRSPAEYPGRAVYAGSRYGLHGYHRPNTGLDLPVPRSMKKVAPPTMYYWAR